MAKRRSRQGLSLVGVILVIFLVIYNLVVGGGGNASLTPTVPAVVTQANTLLPSTTGPISGTDWLKIYFTNPNPPDQVGHGIDNDVVAEVAKAQKTIDVTSFDLNLPSFVNALVAAKQRGVQVRVVYDGTNGSQTLDAKQSTTGQEFNAVSVMQNAG